jgi:hypothetical protein
VEIINRDAGTILDEPMPPRPHAGQPDADEPGLDRGQRFFLTFRNHEHAPDIAERMSVDRKRDIQVIAASLRAPIALAVRAGVV